VADPATGSTTDPTAGSTTDPTAGAVTGSVQPRAVRLCGRDDLAPGEARRFDVADLRVALVRIGDDFYAVGDRCSHEDFSLADGEVWAEECELECAKHGSTFDLRTGEPRSLPATKPVPVYELVVGADGVSVVVP
jgi:3-phenylpropionate/trans-cinnamate dioxygenase ferredoxin component